MFEATELQVKLFFLAKLSAKHTRQSCVFFLDQPHTKYLVNILKIQTVWYMYLIPEGSTYGLFLFQYLTLYLTTKSNKRIYTFYLPQCLTSSIWPTKWSWNLNRDPGSLYRAWGKLGISGENINEPMYTHCCHLHLGYMVNLYGTFRPIGPGFLQMPCSI